MPSRVGISSMRRSSHSLDALVNPGGWIHQRPFSSILTFWRLRAATSSPVRAPPPLFFFFFSRAPGNTLTAFGFSGGIQTHLNEGPPPGIEPSFDLEECDSDSDFDDPVEEDPARARPKVSPDTSEPPQRSIKAYVVKYTAYKTLVDNRLKSAYR